jgi:hypothetical protein
VIVGVFGPGHFRGQEYKNYAHVSDVLDNYEISKIITGGGVGVEQLALRYATTNEIDTEVIPPNIRAHGKESAFIFRNQEIIQIIDLAVLLWDGNDPFYHKLMADCIAKRTPLHVRHVD